MSKADKILEKMRRNPRDWRMESLETIARKHGVDVRKTGWQPLCFSAPGFGIGDYRAVQAAY